MRRFLGSFLVIAGVLSVGLMPASAAEEIPTPLVVLASSETHESEHILIIATPDLLTHPLFQSFFTSYVQPTYPIAALLTTTNGKRDTHSNSDTSNPSVGSDEPDTQSGGADSVREDSNGSELGSGGDITPIPGPKTLQLVELYPNTTGNDKVEEYVALKNTGTQSISLAGWSLQDASGKTFSFKDGSVAPGATTKIHADTSKIALNNDKDSVELHAPDNQLIDSVSYEKAKQGDTFSRKGNTWRWSSDVSANEPTSDETIPVEQPKPASTNTTGTDSSLTQKKETQSKTSDKKVSSSPVNTLKTLSISDAKDSPDETRVELTGVVSVPSGTLGKQFFYIQDDSVGLQVYKHDADFPVMKAGTQIRLSGTMSTSGKERRVKITKDDFLQVISEEATPIPTTVNLEQITQAQSGLLIKTNGVLSSVGSDQLELETQGTNVEISIASYTGIDTSLLKPGMQVEIVGIVRPSGDTVKLSPRSQNDIVILQEDTPLATGTINSGKAQEQKKDQFLGAAITAVTAGAVLFWIVKKQWQKKQNTYVASPLTTGAETVT